MPSEHGTEEAIPAGWIPLENRLYRRDIIYNTLEWSVDPDQLSRAIIAAAPCAGPVALFTNFGWQGSSTLEIYALSGHLIRRFDRLREKTVPPHKVVALGWSKDDLLSVIYNDGAVVRVPGGIHVNSSRFISVLEGNADDRIYDAAIVQNGDIILRGVTGAVYRLSSEDKVQHDVNHVKPPEGVVREVLNGGIAVVQPLHTPLEIVETLFVTETENIALLGSNGLSVMQGDRDVSQICVSPNGQYLAAMESTTGNLFVTTVDLSTEIARVDLVVELSSRAVEHVFSDVIFDARMPKSIAWVGSDAIAVLYREHIVLVGPHGGVAVMHLAESSAQGGIILRSESDGLRVMTAVGLEFIQLVAEPVYNVRCRKQTPGYKLLNSCRPPEASADTTSTRALNRYRLLRELRESGSLLEASRSCIATAYLEVEVQIQKRLLHAAAYGQRYASVFLDDDSSKIVPSLTSAPASVSKKMIEDRSRRDVNMVPTAIAILRVLHAAGAPDSGVPLSKSQFDTLGLSALVARLSRYGKHTLAIRLATFGRISPYEVLAEWAIAAVQANIEESDDAVTTLIAERFETVSRSYTGVDLNGSQRGRALPYVIAAEAAYVRGRPKCAELLLRRETRPAPKVTMYLKMGRENPALIASVSSGDPELVLDALGTVLERKNRSVREIAKLLRTLPPALGNRATDLFACHLRQIGDYNALRIVYAEVGRRREAALVEIFLVDQIVDSRERMTALEKTALNISRGHSRRSCHFEVQAVQHAAVVASNAIELEKKGRLEPGSLRYASDGDLLARAILDIKDVGRRRNILAKLRKELNIPDRRFFWICLDSMAEAGDFESIEALSKSAGHGRAPPIGLTAFVDTCIKYKMDDEAIKYAMRIGDLRDRARALARGGRGREAADIASRLRNQQLLEEVQDLSARHASNIITPPRRTSESERA